MVENEQEMANILPCKLLHQILDFHHIAEQNSLPLHIEF